MRGILCIRVSLVFQMGRSYVADVYAVGSNDASQAILDAAALTLSLLAHPDSITDALTAYQDIRLPVTAKIVSESTYLVGIYISWQRLTVCFGLVCPALEARAELFSHSQLKILPQFILTPLRDCDGESS